MSNWEIAIIVYLTVATSSFIPVFVAMIKKVKLNPSGSSFKDSPNFSEVARESLEQHYSRINGTLVYWKNKAEWNRRFHFYTLFWTIPVAVLIPVIAQTVDQSLASKLFLTIISTHSALLIGFHRALKIENNFKAFRHGESEFYDTYRRMLDRPASFGSDEQEQMENYFIEVAKIRKYVRNAETDNFPMIDDSKAKKDSGQ